MTGKTLNPTVDAILKEAAKKLRPKKTACAADQNAGWLDAEVLLASVVKKDRAWIAAHGEDYLGPVLRKRFEKLVERRTNHEPVAYILGRKDFFGRPFKVNQHTLIPRPESELFIDVLKLRRKTNERFLLWDAGTGCGEIAVTCALEFPKTNVLASDVCRRALKVAETNIKTYKLAKRVKPVHDDLLGPHVRRELKRSDLPLAIAMNLPYLPDRDKQKMAKDVVEQEPHKALFGGPDGLDLINKLLTDVDDVLDVPPKMILIEFDPPQSKKLQTFAKKLFPNAKISVHNDLAGRQRLMEIRL